MDNKEYLKQISGQVRPAKSSKMSFLKSPIVKIAGIAIIAMVIIIIFSSIISAGKPSLENQNISLKLHIDNTLEIISEFQPSVKSSDLRSSSSSLYAVLSNTSRELGTYLETTYNYNTNKPPETLANDADLSRDALYSDLFEAKINGILDRIYARKMAYEISLFTSEESAIYNATKDDSLKSLLTTSYNSLDNLYSKFDDFSETK